MFVYVIYKWNLKDCLVEVCICVKLKWWWGFFNLVFCREDLIKEVFGIIFVFISFYFIGYFSMIGIGFDKW